MNAKIQKLKEEWERCVLYGSGLLLFLVCVFWLMDYGREDNMMLGQKSAPLNPSLINHDTAFAFLNPPPSVRFRKEHPFAFVLEAHKEQPKTKPWKSKTKKKSSKWQAPKWRSSKKKAKAKNNPPPEPIKVKRTQTVEYNGWLTSLSGQKVAHLKDVKTGSDVYLKRGGKIGDFKVVEFQDTLLTLVDSAGKEWQINFGQRKTIELQ